MHVCGLALLVLSSLAFSLQRKRKLFNLPLLFFDCLCYGPLPRGAMGGSAVCNYDLSRPYSPTF